MNRRKVFLAVILSLVLAVLMSFAVSAETTTGWILNTDGTWSYADSEGNLIKDQVGCYIDNSYYGFDANGIMYTGWVQPYQNKFEYDYETRSTWFFFDASGHAAQGYNAETGYLFNGVGSVEPNWWTWVDGKCFVSDDEGRATQLYPVEWNNVNGEWYYMSTDGEFYYGGVYNIAGVDYYFDWNGKLVVDRFAWANDGYVYVNGNGNPIDNGWILVDGKWNYLDNGYRYGNGTYNIDGVDYYFSNYELVQNQRIGEMYAAENGALLYNTWCLNADGEWEFYNVDGYRVYGFYEVEGVKYYFDYDGVMLANQVIRYYDGTWYLLAENGTATAVADGWVLDPHYNKWMYFEEGQPITNVIRVISGVEYAFSDNYLINIDSYDWLDHEEKGYAHYSINADGSVNRNVGWDLANDCWVFIQQDGKLKTGWINDGTGWYYLDPIMYKNTTATIYGRSYYFDANGRSSDVAVNGFVKLGTYETAYNEYCSLTYGWRQIEGKWYYFTGYEVCANGVYTLDNNTKYYFDQDGVMLTGWIHGNDGAWYYAEESGLIVTGIRTMGDVTYAFSSYGELLTSTIVYQDNASYLVNENGFVIAASTDAAGWIENNGNYYYLTEYGWFVNNSTYYIDGVNYAFNYNGTMVADAIWWGSYYQSNGAVATDAWLKIDGVWYYADENGYFVDGLQVIDGTYYYFDGYKLAENGTYACGSEIIVTNASGAVVSRQPMTEGWNLVKTYGEGTYYYVEDGELYFGWQGSYYLDPAMVCNTYRNIDGDYYYFYNDGRYAADTWIKVADGDDDVWYYAQANGKLYRNEWAFIGENWYYFSGIKMVEDRDYTVDGKSHHFAKGGAWLGEDKGSLYADGWYLMDGTWQYCQNGSFVKGGILKIDGVWYGFDKDGLVTNGFNYNGYYMNNSGAVMEYTGWQMIDGKWYYFTFENRAVTGWFTVDGIEYYGTRDEDGLANGIAIGFDYVGGKLYSFADSGACLGEVTADGWYNAGSDWYYVRNGKALADTTAVIGDVLYAFDYDGTMITYGYTYDKFGYRLFGENGAQITAEGWYLIDGAWLYVGADGYLCEGSHVIDGVGYYFDLSYDFGYGGGYGDY